MLEPSKILYVVRKVKSVCTSRNDKSDPLNAARDTLLLLCQLFIHDLRQKVLSLCLLKLKNLEGTLDCSLITCFAKLF